jgi:hypothetical protein
MNEMPGCCRLCSFRRYRSLWLACLLSVPKIMTLNLGPHTSFDLKCHGHFHQFLPVLNPSGREADHILHPMVEVNP